MAIPAVVLELIDRFSRNREAYTSPHYNEMQLRREFLDPFFKALSWDIDNERGYAEAYKDVIHEDAIKVGEATKAPDYCFRIGGTRKFFLEAKKPAVNIKQDSSPAFQLRRYAWTAKLPLSILSDFEELAVYDCRIKPEQADAAATARVLYVHYTEYEKRWDEIAGIFSREAVLKGSFDKYAESSKSKRGTSDVDSEFLTTIESWRTNLARNMALRNPALSQRELNYSVQQTIDRIVFLRICEGRGLEDYGRLRAIASNQHVYTNLCKLFEEADDRYNSGLFHFRREKGRNEEPDELTLSLVLDDDLLRGIIGGLYYPESPYVFSALPADILGQVYEQFLGKVIRLTAGHRAVIEEKPEVKKAGGVYYTPTYVVDFIVKNTLGALLESPTNPGSGRQTLSAQQVLNRVGNIHIVDPACGSGSFLLVAYQYLLDWHLEFYTNSDPVRWARGGRPALVEVGAGRWRLTISERKRILISNIFGVDIDAQAVETTKLSLLLKVLEGETQQTLQPVLRAFQERALPDLASNIKCGNSLIGPDFYRQHQLALSDEQERFRINAFDWGAEFSAIVKGGGFDAVVGNPPWGALLSDSELDYLRAKHREIIVRMIDSFMYFVRQGASMLKENGYFGMILPDVILYQTDNQKLRQFVLDNFRIDQVVKLGDVFERVTRPACTLILQRGAGSDGVIRTRDLSRIPKALKARQLHDTEGSESLLQSQIAEIPGRLFVTENVSRYALWEKVLRLSHDTLGELVDEDGIQRGVSPDLKEAFIVSSDIAQKYQLERVKLRRVITGGKQVKRYFIQSEDLFLIYTTREDEFRALPNIRHYVDQFRDRITCKEVKDKKHSVYALHRARDEKIFLKTPKFCGVITEDEIVVALDFEQTFATDGLYVFGLRSGINQSYLLGLLNSKLFVFIYRLLALESGRVLAQVKPTVLLQLPIKRVDLSNSSDRGIHDDIVKLSDGMQKQKKVHAAARVSQDRVRLEREMAATQANLDSKVYELYCLGASDISVVEGAVH